MKFEPIMRAPTAWTSLYKRLAIHVFEGRVTLEDMEQMQLVGERWTAKNPGKRVELVVIFPSNTRMTLEERQRMAQVIKQGEAYRAASATVILAEGILASMQRSVLTGMMMIAPSPHPVKVFGEVDGAAKFLLPFVHELCDASLLLAELTHALHTHLALFASRPDRPSLPPS